MRFALTRPLSPAILRCELTHLTRQPIDFSRAQAEHLGYERALASCGLTVEHLPALPDSPDGVFVEDTAVVLPELAVIARPGAASRQGEVTSTRGALARHRPLATIEAPGTLDGGDVLVVGRSVYVGNSGRTNDEGVAQLERILGAKGYRVKGVPVTGCLHLKTAVTRVAEDVLLFNPAFVDDRHFTGVDLIEVDPAEPSAANALYLGPVVIYPEAHPRTGARLEARGVTLHRVAVTELAKAEAGVTCCSLVFDV